MNVDGSEVSVRRRVRVVAIAAAAVVMGTVVMSVSSTAGAQSVRPRAGSFHCEASAVRVESVAPALTVEPLTIGRDSTCADGADGVVHEHVYDSGAGVEVGVLNVTSEQHPDDLDTNFPSINDRAHASGQAEMLEITAGTYVIRVSLLRATATARCAGSAALGLTPSLSSSSYVDWINVAGVPTLVGTQPMQIPLPNVGTLYLNHTETTGTSITQRALWLDTAGVDVVVAEAKAGLSGNPCAMRPRVVA